MRKSASEIIHELEMRVARLERVSSSNPILNNIFDDVRIPFGESITEVKSLKSRKQLGYRKFNEYLIRLLIGKIKKPLESLKIEYQGQTYQGKLEVSKLSLILKMPDSLASMLNETEKVYYDLTTFDFDTNASPSLPTEAYGWDWEWEPLKEEGKKIAQVLRDNKISKKDLKDLYTEVYEFLEMYEDLSEWQVMLSTFNSIVKDHLNNKSMRLYPLGHSLKRVRTRV